MPKISPVSELRNYGTVLEKVEPGTPVYLTRNGMVHTASEVWKMKKNS